MLKLSQFLWEVHRVFIIVLSFPSIFFFLRDVLKSKSEKIKIAWPKKLNLTDFCRFIYRFPVFFFSGDYEYPENSAKIHAENLKKIAKIF